jgi:hypothetical protein
MNGHFLVVLISPAGSAAAERTEGEPPGDPKRSARLERNSMAEENPTLRRQNAGLRTSSAGSRAWPCASPNHSPESRRKWHFSRETIPECGKAVCPALGTHLAGTTSLAFTALAVPMMFFSFFSFFSVNQYSSGSRRVVEERSASVMTHSLSPAAVRWLLRRRKPCCKLR